MINGLYKEKDKYDIYDPNHQYGEVNFNHIDDVTQFLLKSFFIATKDKSIDIEIKCFKYIKLPTPSPQLSCLRNMDLTSWISKEDDPYYIESFFLSSAVNDYDMVVRLINLGVDPFTLTKNNLSSFNAACIFGYDNIILAMLKNRKCDLSI